ncbi:arginine--tRNA ligase [Candidatus Phytoplasma prunorum]|uniref:arginine--tRNA ligase n=1 Tax=Candidatus Phytoplasma prunorum TaxID=47565 RepID=UPI002FEF9075
MIFFNIKNKLEKKLICIYNIDINLINNSNNFEIDFFIPLFLYSKLLKKEILTVFKEFKEILLNYEEISTVELLNGFLNIKLKRNLLTKNILLNIVYSKDKYGSKKYNNQTIVLDYSSPNIAKNFSIGHLRSTVIGNSLKNIYQKLGFKTISINHLGDWGTQFGKLILAYKKWVNHKNFLEDPINELQKLYVFFHEQAKINPKLNQEASDLFYQLEQKNDEIIGLWKLFKEISLKEFHKIYDLLGINFDYYIGESFYNDKISNLMLELKQKKILKLDQNAYIITLNDLLPPALIQKKNGSTVYLTRDIAALLYRFRCYNFSKILYVVGNEQKLHFQQLKQVVLKMGYNIDLVNVNFGLILFKGKKLSTRFQKTIKLIDVIEQIKKLSKQIITIKNPNLLNIEDISTKIAIGSIIFNDLKNNRHLDIDFDIERMIKLEGQTGSYLQYTLVRINSILERITKEKQKEIVWHELEIDNNNYLKEHYFILIKLLDSFSLILEQTKIENMPSILARYLLKIAKKFNHFYSKEKIITSQIILQNTNVLLVKSVSIILKEGLRLLGIPLLDKM